MHEYYYSALLGRHVVKFGGSVEIGKGLPTGFIIRNVLALAKISIAQIYAVFHDSILSIV